MRSRKRRALVAVVSALALLVIERPAEAAPNRWCAGTGVPGQYWHRESTTQVLNWDPRGTNYLVAYDILYSGPCTFPTAPGWVSNDAWVVYSGLFGSNPPPTSCFYQPDSGPLSPNAQSYAFISVGTPCNNAMFYTIGSTHVNYVYGGNQSDVRWASYEYMDPT